MSAAHTENVECRHCEGSGRVSFGDFGSYYRDGEQYNAPGEQNCEHCDGSGHEQGMNAVAWLLPCGKRGSWAYETGLVAEEAVHNILRQHPGARVWWSVKVSQ